MSATVSVAALMLAPMFLWIGAAAWLAGVSKDQLRT